MTVSRPRKWTLVSQPKKWLWGLFPLAALGLGAWAISSPSLETTLKDAAGSELKSNGIDWASVSMDGRDAVLGGIAPEEDAVSKAAKIVAGTYGVRRVDVAGISIAPPVVLSLPTVQEFAGRSRRPDISGTWPEGVATMLEVRVADQTYTLGSDTALTSDGSGNWTLLPSAALAEGEHDVTVTVSDGKKAMAADNTTAEILIDVTAPGAPTVVGLTGDAARPTITGGYDKDATSLAVTTAGKTFILGQDDELSTDDAGNWSLAMPNKLEPGSYDVWVMSKDKLGNTSSVRGRDFVSVAKPPQPKAPATPTVGATEGFSNTPTLKGTWPERDGNELGLVVDGETYNLASNDELSSDGSGNWSLTPSTPLKDGNYDVIATVTSKAGLSSQSNVGRISVLATAPAAPVVAEVAGYGNTPTVTGTWPEGNGNTLSVALAGKDYQLDKDDALQSDGSGNWSLTLHEELADGAYDAVATATNVAGHSANSNTGQFAVLTTVPATPTVDPVIGFSSKPMVTGSWPEGSGNSLNVVLAGTSYQLGKDDALSSDGAGKWSLTPHTTLADGGYDATATVTNVAGYTTKSEPANITVLTAAPATPTALKAVGFESKPTLKGTWPEGGGNNLSVAVASKTYLLGTDVELTSDGSGNWSLTPSSALPEGTLDVKVTARNLAGMSTSDVTIGEVQVDTTPPARPRIASLISRESRPAITGTWQEDDAGSLSVGVGGKAYELSETGALTSDGKGNWSLTLDSDLADGTHEVVAAANDAAGNVARDISRAEVTIDTTAPMAPTIVSQLTRERLPVVSGFWPSDEAASLSVALGSETFTSGQSDVLKIDGDGWTLNVPNRLEDGTYDIKAIATDSVGNSTGDASRGELVVDTTPPDMPVVNLYKSGFAKPLLTGTFPEKDTEHMTVSFGDETFNLGTKSGPISDGNGTWAVNTDKEYAPGVYDVKVVVTDAAGNQRSDSTLNEIEILAPPPLIVAKKTLEPVPAAKAAIDCQKLFDDVLANESIQFRTGRSSVDRKSAELIKKLVEVVKQCPDAKIEIAGHTDSRGSSSSNKRLSENRAVAVREALKIKGAPASNITAVGYGESEPIADNSSQAGRAKNRRTVFTVNP